ncbi:MAG: DUF222 domain-containing protein [Candidatus Nanopelagicales bacterium]
MGHLVAAGDLTRFVRAAERMLHPPPDPTPQESDAHSARALSFALTGDSVIISGELPRLEGELVVAAIDAFAERLRSAADHVPAAARRADALVELVNAAHASGSLPTRGGLPVSVTVTLEHCASGDPLWTTARGHLLTEAQARWAACDTALTPLLVAPRQGAADEVSDEVPGTRPAARLAALAAVMFTSLEPLAVGRTQRAATPAQRRVLAVRDGGCIIPGCQVPAEACQTHHVQEWSEGGPTDLANLALLCWAHHRQVDLRMWTIAPASSTRPIRSPDPNAPPGTPWPGNSGSPWVVTRTPRTRWRL